MKNEAIESQASPPAEPARGGAATDAWGAALRRFDREMQRRGAAERKRRAYGADVGELAAWSASQGLLPADLDYRRLRRWAARISQNGAAPSTLARKLASVRA